MMFAIGTFILTILFLAILLIVSPLLYKRRNEEDFDIRNCFPFELNYRSEFKENFYTHLILALFILATCGFYATFNTSYSGYLLFIMIGGILSTFAIYALFYVPLLRLKGHIIVATLAFTLRLATSASIFIASWKVNQNMMSWASITSIVLSSIAMFISLALIFNPKLTLNFHRMEVVKENGEKDYVRPNYVWLALSEWMLIFLNIFNILNIVILTFTIE